MKTITTLCVLCASAFCLSAQNFKAVVDGTTNCPNATAFILLVSPASTPGASPQQVAWCPPSTNGIPFNMSQVASFFPSNTEATPVYLYVAAQYGSNPDFTNSALVPAGGQYFDPGIYAGQSSSPGNPIVIPFPAPTGFTVVTN